LIKEQKHFLDARTGNNSWLQEQEHFLDIPVKTRNYQATLSRCKNLKHIRRARIGITSSMQELETIPKCKNCYQFLNARTVKNS
jgi:hypothetical protein